MRSKVPTLAHATAFSGLLITCLLFTVICGTESVADDSLAIMGLKTKFEGRAVEATAEVLKAGSKLKEMDQKELKSDAARALVSRIVLESAYAAHITVTDIVQKSDDDSYYFHLILRGAGNSLFDLVYKYTKEGKHLATQVKELPKGWHLVFSNTLGRRISVVTDDKSVFIFSLVDPFDSTTVPLSEAEKTLLEPEPKRR